MKKWSFLMLFALLLMPIGGQAEDLPDFLNAVSQGLSEGLAEGAAVISAASQDLTLALSAEDARIEEGRTITLTLTAGNPYPTATDVTFTLNLPERLTCAHPLTWNAQLDAAKTDPQTGNLVPSMAVFTREVTLAPGGGSEQTQLSAELAMGSRFYRAQTPLALCVPDISAKASVEGAENQLVEAGDAFAYQIEIVNDGTAPKDVPVSLLLPAGVSPDGALPAGFTLRGRTIHGAVRAQAEGQNALRMAMRVDSDVLRGDEDACKLLSGILTVDGKRTAMPLLKAVGAKINATLTPARSAIEEGETMTLVLTLANTGLAPADVQVSCRLPEGLTLLRSLTDAPKAAAKDAAADPSAQTDDNASKEDDGDAPVLPAGEDPLPPADGATEAVMSDAADMPAQAEIHEENGLVTLALRMDAARETESGIAAATQEVTLRVRADMPIENLSNRTLGASLAWTIDGGDTQLGEAVALQVRKSGMMGLSDAEWNGILLAALLMIVTVCCLYSVVKSDNKNEEYCFE